MRKLVLFFFGSIFIFLSSAAVGQDLEWIRLGHGGQVNYLDFSSDGKQLSSSGPEQLFKIWNTNTKKIERIITCTSGTVLMDYSFSGDTLFTIQHTTNDKGYLFSAWDPTNSLLFYSSTIPDTADYPNEEIKAITHIHNTLITSYWDRKKHASTIVLRGMLNSRVDTLGIVQNQIIYYLCLDHTNRQLISSGADSVLRIWDINTSSLKQTIAGVNWGNSTFSEFSNAVVVKQDSTISAFDIQSGTLLGTFKEKTLSDTVTIIPAPNNSVAVFISQYSMMPVAFDFLSGQKIADL
ncbi:MAG TPA: hypothetical protein VFO76_00185, partial [Candidatus Kapabacteria bacterium]|nr:hypothetical protein [Candidatus Kapabacteria bacterium]